MATETVPEPAVQRPPALGPTPPAADRPATLLFTGPQSKSFLQRCSLISWHQNTGASWICSASRKGRKASRKGGGGSGSGSGSGQPIELQNTIRESREQQLTASNMLATLLEADDPAAVAAEHVASLNEEVGWLSWGRVAHASRLGRVEGSKGASVWPQAA